MDMSTFVFKYYVRISKQNFKQSQTIFIPFKVRLYWTSHIIFWNNNKNHMNANHDVQALVVIQESIMKVIKGSSYYPTQKSRLDQQIRRKSFHQTGGSIQCSYGTTDAGQDRMFAKFNIAEDATSGEMGGFPIRSVRMQHLLRKTLLVIL